MYETVIYAHMKTFRFTGTPALYIECDVRMCHGKCPVSSKVQQINQTYDSRCNQTMPCDWREGALGGGHSVRRRRRSTGNITAVLPDQLVEDEEEDDKVDVDRAPKSLGNFSESLNLFQSIQVLANEEEERAFMNETASSECNHLD